MLGHVAYLDWLRDAFARTRFSLASSGAMPPGPEVLAPLKQSPVDLMTLRPGEATRAFEGAVAARWGVPETAVIAAAGTTGANFLCMAALLSPGDEVIIEGPAYGPLIDTARGLGAHIRRLDRPLSTGHQPDPEALDRLLTPRTRLVVLTCPHNPSGAVLEPARLEAILGRVEAQGRAFVLLDAVYRELLPLSGADLFPQAWREGPLLVTASLTKAYGLPELRAGFVIAPPGLRRRLMAAADHVLPGAPGPAWWLAAEILGGDIAPAIREGVRAHLDAAGPRLVAFLDRMPELKCHRPPVPFIVFPRLPEGRAGSVLSARLLDAHGVLVVPGRHFGDDGYIRLAAFAPVSDVETGLAHLEAALSGP